MLRGNQHGGREYDDLQNWLDMTSHENPLLHSGQSTHFKGWGFEILKNCKRVGVHIFPLKRVD